MISHVAVLTNGDDTCDLQKQKLISRGCGIFRYSVKMSSDQRHLGKGLITIPEIKLTRRVLYIYMYSSPLLPYIKQIRSRLISYFSFSTAFPCGFARTITSFLVSGNHSQMFSWVRPRRHWHARSGCSTHEHEQALTLKEDRLSWVS